MNNILDQNLILKGKKVLLRVDLNVPMKNGAITETSRIEKILPTIKLLIEKEAKIIILSHIGRPKGQIVNRMSLEPISKKLSQYLNIEILFNKNKINENTIFEINKIITAILIAILLVFGIGKISDIIFKANQTKVAAFKVEALADSTSKAKAEAGVDILVSGTTIFKENGGDLKKNIQLLKTG